MTVRANIVRGERTGCLADVSYVTAAGAQRLGLVGGSFNPVHCAHLALAQAALHSGKIDRALFLPTGNPPYKLEKLADKRDRLAMVELAVQGEPRMAVSRVEIDREGPVYTVDTLRILADEYPGSRLVYILGADALARLDRWRAIDEVIRLCGFLVMARPGGDETAVCDEVARWRARGADMEWSGGPRMEISSTMVRERAAAGLSLDGLTPPAVAAYIARHGLYRDKGTNHR